MSNLDDFIPGPKIAYQACSKALSVSKLPDLDYALNPYTGCSHCCTYCYAPDIMRIDRSEWGRVKVKSNIAKILAKELSAKRGVIGLGTVTDPYQPVEKIVMSTRACLNEIVKEDVPVSVLTKSDLILRDFDLYSKLSKAEIGISIACDDAHSSVFEKNVPKPSERLRAAKEFADAGMNIYVLIGPVIHNITDLSSSLIDDIADSGVKRVMIDALNLRPGMASEMESLLPGSSKNSQQDISRIKFKCKTLGLKTEDVF